MRNEPTGNTEVKQNFWKVLLIQKFSHPFALFFLLITSLVISFLTYKLGFIGVGAVLAITIGLPIVFAITVYPEFGICALITGAFFISYIAEFLPSGVPIGTLMDVTTYLLILGFFIKQRTEQNWTYFKNPISYMILVWLAYNMLEFVNPAAASRLAWIYTVRTVGFIMLMYFVFVYQIRTVKFIKTLLKLWLLLDILAGISAFQQENIGFFPFERRSLYSDPLRVSLLFINGHMRKFAIFSDPVTFSYNMVIGALLCIVLIMGNLPVKRKVLLGFIAAFFLYVMLYSGTRAAYVLVPGALSMLAVLNFNKRVLIFTLVAAGVLGILIVMPTSNPLIKRFQTAFNPSDDASYNVRAENQRRIKPYILSHPIGGGLGSVGVWGRKFSPNSMLAKFPPDSGYVRVAVEMGWIGLILFCTLFFVVLKTGINFYFSIKNPELKNYCLAMLLILFAFNIGNFPQQAIVQYPSNILFYLAISILVVCKRLDNQEQEQLKKIIVQGGNTN